MNYELEPDEIGVFLKLIVLSARCSNNGFIADNDGKPLAHSFISHRLFISTELLERTIKKCIATSRIRENSKGIEIINWRHYQDEYQRQKPYREAKKKKEKTTEQQKEETYQTNLSVAVRERKAKLGRQLTNNELSEIMDKISSEIYGDEPKIQLKE
jgi:hypothetical protein